MRSRVRHRRPSIALFRRAGGGVYTKAADGGAGLSGKNEYGPEEDAHCNPAGAADHVGDNVGDIAGLGANLFGPLVESTCATLVLRAACPTLAATKRSPMYPVLISSAGIAAGIFTLILG